MAAASGGLPSAQVGSANEPLLGTQSVAGLEAKSTPNGAEPSVTNGVAGTAAPGVPNRAGKAPTFTRVVSVLARSPHYKHYTLSDLEWLVVPPILTGQCAVMEAKVNGRQVPVAAALWAGVSEEVDKRLSENLATPIKLRPDEWRCGEILWLVDAVGDPNAIPHLLRQLQGGPFKGRQANVRTFGPDGPTVSNLQSVTPP